MRITGRKSTSNRRAQRYVLSTADVYSRYHASVQSFHRRRLGRPVVQTCSRLHAAKYTCLSHIETLGDWTPIAISGAVCATVAILSNPGYSSLARPKKVVPNRHHNAPHHGLWKPPGCCIKERSKPSRYDLRINASILWKGTTDIYLCKIGFFLTQRVG